MSTKLATFATKLGNPQNIHNFLVTTSILGDDISVLVQSTDFPSVKLQKMVLHFQGEPINYPTLPKPDGVWTCMLPEAEDAKIFKAAIKAQGTIHDQKTGLILLPTKTDIKIQARGLGDAESFSTTLKGCFIVGKDPVGLDNSDATKNWIWKLEFSYDWIDDGTAI